MATTAKGKEAIKEKEKRGLSPSGPRSINPKRGLSPAAGHRNIDQSTGRAVPKSSSIAVSPDTHHSFLSEKPIPNYLKPTISSGLDEHGKKQPHPENKKLLRRRSFDKPPSPSQIHKTPAVSSTTRERSTLKSLVPTTKTTSSPILKTVKKKIPSSTIKKEPNVKATATSSSSIKHEKEKKVKVEEEVVKNENEEVIEDPPILDLKFIDLPDPEEEEEEEEEEEILEEVKSEPCVCSTFTEEQQQVIVETHPHIEEAEEKKTTHDEEDVHGQEQEEDSHKNAEQPEENLASKPQEAEAEAEEARGGDNATESLSVHEAKVTPIEVSGDDKTPNQLKEGKDMEVMNEEVKVEPEKVVMKRQDVQGKKESRAAYNNVIEETASKLVGKRKSKVKALVGAFETVISLEEGQTPKANESSKVEGCDTTLTESPST